jgi:hypothetical protein
MKYYRPGESRKYKELRIFEFFMVSVVASGFTSLISLFIWGIIHNFKNPTNECVLYMLIVSAFTFMVVYIIINGKIHLNNFRTASKELERIKEVEAERELNIANREKHEFLKFIETCKNENK